MRRRMVAIGAAVAVALAVAVLAAQAFPTAKAAAPAKTIELPQELEHLMFMACLPGLYPGSGDAGPNGGGVVAEQGFVFSSDGSDRSDGALSVRIEAVGDWSVTVSRTGATMQNERPSADQAQMITIASEVMPAAQSLYDCLAPYRFAARDAELPSSRAQLLQLYRYDTAVLWPCLRSQGIDVGDPPSRDQFVSSFSARTADPISAMTVTRKMLPRLATALRVCPLRPAYLG
jgi:hypothetical protein